MRVLIDGDACPNKDDLFEVCNNHSVEMIVFADYAHISYDVPYEVVYCEVGNDSVDMVLLRHVQSNDIVITQDYGLAGLVLSKKAKVLHVSGKEINEFNIEGLLSSRYMSAKMRNAHKRVKGPTKRTEDEREFLLTQLEGMIKEVTLT